METPKNTGLGGSLLLRRTEPAAQPEPIDVSKAPDVSTSETSKRSDARNAKASKRLALQDRITLYLDRDVNQRLDLAARVEGKKRSEVANEILQQHLPTYHIESVE